MDSLWGIIDVNDCATAVQLLPDIDPKKSFMRGRSSGGFTSLASICSKPDVYAGSTSICGISDLVTFVAETHKFESKYTDKLLGGSLQQVPKVYKERSPINNADKIKTPLLILQGAEDTVVPPIQAEVIVKSIKDRGGCVKYILFQGEGHIYHKADSIKRALEEELAWYVNLLGANTA